MHSRNLLDCLYPAVLSLQQILGWLKPPIKTMACEHCELLLSVYKGPNLFGLLDQLAYKLTITSPVYLLLLVLIHKLSASSSPIPRWSSTHSSCLLS